VLVLILILMLLSPSGERNLNSDDADLVHPVPVSRRGATDGTLPWSFLGDEMQPPEQGTRDRMTMRFLAKFHERCRLAVALSIAGLGAACAYDEAQSWRECCALTIAGRDETSPKERQTLIAWGRTPGFLGDGRPMDSENSKASRRKQIAYGLAVFQEQHRGAPARDYLASLGMTCGAVDAKPVDTRQRELTRCAAELPVQVQCTVMISWPFLSTPVPKELREPIAAFLQMTIDVSGSDIIDSSVRVMPVPGGRLCHR